MSFAGYQDECKAKGWSVDRLNAKWEEYTNDRRIDRSGSGANSRLWIPQLRERLRDKTKGSTNSFQEGGKRTKALKASDSQALKDFATASALSHGDDFFAVGDDKRADPGKPILKEEEEGEILGLMTKKLDLAILIPPQFDKMIKELERLEAAMQGALAKAQEAVRRASSEELSLPGQSLLLTCRLRISACNVWFAVAIDEAMPPIQTLQELATDPDAKQKLQGLKKPTDTLCLEDLPQGQQTGEESNKAEAQGVQQGAPDEEGEKQLKKDDKNGQGEDADKDGDRIDTEGKGDNDKEAEEEDQPGP